MPEKYKGLEIGIYAKYVLITHPDVFAGWCNGAGSEIGFWGRLTYYLIPAAIRNTAGGVDLTPATDIHDVEYQVPAIFRAREQMMEAKRAADDRFYHNLTTLINRVAPNPKGWWRRRKKAYALHKARMYYFLVRDYGRDSYEAGKTIDPHAPTNYYAFIEWMGEYTGKPRPAPVPPTCPDIMRYLLSESNDLEEKYAQLATVMGTSVLSAAKIFDAKFAFHWAELEAYLACRNCSQLDTCPRIKDLREKHNATR